MISIRTTSFSFLFFNFCTIFRFDWRKTIQPSCARTIPRTCQFVSPLAKLGAQQRRSQMHFPLWMEFWYCKCFLFVTIHQGTPLLRLFFFLSPLGRCFTIYRGSDASDPLVWFFEAPCYRPHSLSFSRILFISSLLIFIQQDNAQAHNIQSMTCMFSRIDAVLVREEVHRCIELLVHEWFWEIPLTIIESQDLDELSRMTGNRGEGKKKRGVHRGLL